ncbi:hypothetical protein AgCh_034072 [Apium graveolens]
MVVSVRRRGAGRGNRASRGGRGNGGGRVKQVEGAVDSVGKPRTQFFDDGYYRNVLDGFEIYYDFEQGVPVEVGEEITKEGKQAATPGSGGKKKDHNEVELTPPENQAPPPPITAVDEQAAMTYLEGLADQMNEINTWISRVERNSGRNAKGKARHLKVSQRSWKGKSPQKRLIHNFDDATTETKQKKEASHEEEDIPQGHDERGSQISKRSRQKPASSEARSTSVLDRVGKKLSEHDLILS